MPYFWLFYRDTQKYFLSTSWMRQFYGAFWFCYSFIIKLVCIIKMDDKVWSIVYEKSSYCRLLTGKVKSIAIHWNEWRNFLFNIFNWCCSISNMKKSYVSLIRETVYFCTVLIKFSSHYSSFIDTAKRIPIRNNERCENILSVT